MGNKTTQDVTLDKYARDSDMWLTHGQVVYSAARKLFELGDVYPNLYFSAATLGQTCLEVLIKGVLIQEGMVSFNPDLINKLAGESLTKQDCVWGHSLIKLAEELERRAKFDLDEIMLHSGIHEPPFTVREGLNLFDPFFEELRYPHGLERVQGFGAGDEQILDELAERILTLKRS